MSDPAPSLPHPCRRLAVRVVDASGAPVPGIAPAVSPQIIITTTRVKGQVKPTVPLTTDPGMRCKRSCVEQHAPWQTAQGGSHATVGSRRAPQHLLPPPALRCVVQQRWCRPAPPACCFAVGKLNGIGDRMAGRLAGELEQLLGPLGVAVPPGGVTTGGKMREGRVAAQRRDWQPW